MEDSRPFAILPYEAVQVSEPLEIKSIKFRPYVIVVQFMLGPALSRQACYLLEIGFKPSQRCIFRNGDLDPILVKGRMRLISGISGHSSKVA